MRKQDLVDSISKTTKLPATVVAVVLEALQGEIIEIIENDDMLSIPGFLKLGTKVVAAKTYTDFQSGEKRIVPSRKVPYITFSQKIKDIARQADFDL